MDWRGDSQGASGEGLLQGQEGPSGTKAQEYEAQRLAKHRFSGRLESTGQGRSEGVGAGSQVGGAW